MAIDRAALVRRHDPRPAAPDPASPLSVGNGEFAFSADFTGLQTFPPAPGSGTPLCTMAQWAWHSFPETAGRPRREDALALEEFDVGGRKVGYLSRSAGQEALFDELRVNPHRLNLARLSFLVDGAAPEPARCSAFGQRLDLWAGRLDSAFDYGGVPVRVRTVCHPHRDCLAVRVESPLLAAGRLAVGLDFPYGSPLRQDASDWTRPDRHASAYAGARSASGFRLLRVLDADRYFVDVRLGGSGRPSHRRTGPHSFALEASGDVLELCLHFTPQAPREAPDTFAATERAAARHWEGFWTRGGAVELADSRDPRAPELERRIVLSQYLTAIQCAGSLPPAETGLTCNSWYGKFHLEMHYWHAAHWPLWNRPELLERSLWWYRAILPSAAARAASQGYQGARWPKMTDPSGRDSPSAIGPFLIWQQPHPIMYAELLRRSAGSAAAADRIEADYACLVDATADFMADYARLEGGGRRVLGPALIPAQENHDPRVVLNPAYELEYWRWGLSTAQAWRQARGLAGHPAWRSVLADLAPPPLDGAGRRYLAHENCPDSYGRFAADHPSFLFALGVLDGARIDRTAMAASLDAVVADWDSASLWGWDFPAMALTAARLGRRGQAVDLLLSAAPKNTYRPNGHNAQLPGTELPLYLPGNGGLLLAVAGLAAGWDGPGTAGGGRSGRIAPLSGRGAGAGFPDDGSWTVSFEGLRPLP
jgi:hypothetical protein